MVADPRGRALADCHTPITYFTPEGESELTREFHPQAVLDSAATLVARTLAEAHITPSSLAAIGITGQRHGLVCLDKQGHEIFVSPNVDLRAAFEGAALQEEFGDCLYEAAGQYPAMLLAPAKLRWLQANRPASHAETSHVLTIAGWLACKLTGIPACEPSLAAGIGLLHLPIESRNPAFLAELGIPLAQLPSLHQSGAAVGKLDPEIARRWRLPHHIPVTLAGADTSVALVGMGLTHPGDTALVAGWSAAIQSVTDTPQPDPQAAAWYSPSPVADLWVSEANLGDAGNAHRWLKDLVLGPDASFDQSDDLASTSPMGSNGCIVYLGQAPLTAPEAGLRRGGLLFSTPLQYRYPTPADILRGFYEALAYAIKANLATLERASGNPVSLLHLGGGMARSSLFAEVLASVTGRTIRRSDTLHASLRGAVAAAAVAAGIHLDLSRAAQTMAPGWTETKPDPSDALEYEDFYQQWKLLYHRIQD